MHILTSIAYHRNGITGEGFHVVLFKARERGEPTRNMVAIAFNDPEQIAILDADMTAAGNVTFGENSWRHEHYADAILGWIAEYRRERDEAPFGVVTDSWHSSEMEG